MKGTDQWFELKALVVNAVEELERCQDRRPPLDNLDASTAPQLHLTPLSVYMTSKSAEVTHRQYMASPRGSLWAAKVVAKLVYGESVTWEQLREVYGTMPLF